MTFWTWMFFIFFGLSLIPLAWIVGHAVGMERTSWARTSLFALVEVLTSLLAVRSMSLGYFVLDVLFGVVAALLVSPLVFRALLTREYARAVLGAFLLTVVTVGGTALVLML